MFSLATIFENIKTLLENYWQVFVFEGVKYTLILSAIAVFFGSIFGVIIAIGRMSNWKPFRFLNKKKAKKGIVHAISEFNPISFLCSAYTEILRDTPLLLQLYLFVIILPTIIKIADFSMFTWTSIALALNSAAYVSELVRSGIQAVDKGQTEAARSLGMNNPAIYSVYQQAVQSLPGLSFDTVRCLADIYLEQKDYVMAKKYIDILDHTTCHRKWVKERRARLETIKGSVPEYRMGGQQFILQSFLPDISAMVDLYPQEKKYADYLLCGILAQKDGSTFYNVFQVIASHLFPDGKDIPELYQQALLLVASHDQNVLTKYMIDEHVWKRFADFTELMSQGRTAQAKRKYAGTYWGYVY
jgi:His/Glu/Gln/Arg/opine family amino acid ABC transporter permease subunit